MKEYPYGLMWESVHTVCLLDENNALKNRSYGVIAFL